MTKATDMAPRGDAVSVRRHRPVCVARAHADCHQLPQARADFELVFLSRHLYLQCMRHVPTRGAIGTRKFHGQYGFYSCSQGSSSKSTTLLLRKNASTPGIHFGHHANQTRQAVARRLRRRRRKLDRLSARAGNRFVTVR